MDRFVCTTIASSNERCEVSRACWNILRISFDEEFRNEIYTSLGVTNSADAEYKIKKSLRDVFNGEGLIQSQTQLTNQDSQYIQDSTSCSTNIRIQGVEEEQDNSPPLDEVYEFDFCNNVTKEPLQPTKRSLKLIDEFECKSNQVDASLINQQPLSMGVEEVLEQEQDSPPALNEIYEFDFYNDAPKEPLQPTTQLKLIDVLMSNQIDEPLINQQPLSKVNNVEKMVEGSEQQYQDLDEIYEFDFDDISSGETLEPTSLRSNLDDWHSKKSTNNVITSVTEKSFTTKMSVTLDKYNKEQTNQNNIGKNIVEERKISQMTDLSEESHSIFQEKEEDEFDFWNS